MDDKDAKPLKEDSVLRKVQKVELEILLEFDRICKKHDLPYQLFAGTLLGAIRHEGFIPWDDDIDICMLRKDYEKFLKIAKEELDSKYFLQTYKTDKDFFNLFAKIRKNNTLLVEKDTEDTSMHKGIFIDIVPLDNNKYNTWQGEAQRKIIYYLQVINQSRYKNSYTKTSNPIKKYMMMLFHYLLKLLPNNFLDSIIEKVAIMFNRKETNYVCDFGTASHSIAYHQFVMKREDFNNTISWEFENTLFPIPKNYDSILTKNYGDYMSMPPKSAQTSHHGITRISFDKNKSYEIEQ